MVAVLLLKATDLVATARVAATNNTKRVLPSGGMCTLSDIQSASSQLMHCRLCLVHENCTHHRFFKRILIQIASSNLPIPQPQPIDSL